MTKTDLKIHAVEALDRGLAYGEACFETFRVIGGEVLALERHLQRLSAGLERFGIRLSGDELGTIAAEALRLAGLRGDDVLVRITITGGTATWGLLQRAEPEVYIQCSPYQTRSEPVELAAVEWPLPLLAKTAKFTTDYALALRAMQQWKLRQGAVPLICREGSILSSLTANVLILREGRWLTPDTSDGGVLPGVVRSLLLENGLAEPARCPLEWLTDCEALLLTNSTHFAAPAASVNGRALDTMPTALLPVRELLNMYPGVSL